MRIDVVTLFPEMFGVVRDLGVTGRAHAQGRWSLHAWNPRDFTHDVHRTVDDRPYGAVRACDDGRSAGGGCQRRPAGAGCPGLGPAPVALLAPVGRRYDQAGAEAMAASDGLILICGRYEGVDQRFIERCVTRKSRWATLCCPAARSPRWRSSMPPCACCPACSTMATRPCRTRSTIRCPACWTVRITRPEVYEGAAVRAAAQRSPCADRRLAASARSN